MEKKLLKNINIVEDFKSRHPKLFRLIQPVIIMGKHFCGGELLTFSTILC